MINSPSRTPSTVADPPAHRQLRVLITSSYFWPEGAGTAPYVTGLAEHLAGRGHEVVVTTGFPHYPDWRSSARRRAWASEHVAGASVRRRWHYVPRRQSAAHRAAYESSLLALGLTALPLRRRPDVVVATCPSLAAGVLGATAAALYRSPFLLVFQDLMGPAAAQSGITGGARVWRTVATTERALARRATAVGVIAEGFRSYFEDAGLHPDKIVRLRNWTRRTEPVESAAETRARFGWGAGEFVCLHGGNLGQKQGLDNLLEAASLLRGENVRIVLAGDGNDRSRLERLARELALDNLDFVELQGPGRWEEIMQASDVLLVNQRPSVTDMSLPSKLTSYFAASRPIVAAASPSSETAREIAAAGAGDVVAPDDPRALCDAIVALKSDPDRRAALAAGGVRYATTVLSAERILADYERVLEELARRRAAGTRRAATAPSG